MELKKYKLGEIVDFNKETISRQDNLLEIKYLDTSNILDNVIYETPSMKLSEAPSRAQRKVKHLTIIYQRFHPSFVRQFNTIVCVLNILSVFRPSFEATS